MTIEAVDYIVVGGGTAGCVVAARLAQDSRNSVLLIEAGGKDSHPLIAVPGANVVTGNAPALNWNYSSAAVPELGGRSLYWAQGRVLGGSSSINGMMFLRGLPEDYDVWRDMGCEGWGHDDVLPYFRRSETNERGASTLHGGEGPVRVSRGRSTAPICDLFLEAAAQAGFPVVDDLNAETGEAFGYVDLSLSRGRRSSTSRAYLRSRKPANLRVVTRAVATRLTFDGKRVTGVAYRRGGSEHVVTAGREVVLSAGAVNSPQLLMLSGIGPAIDLAAKGIAVRLDAPEVGRNLQNHPMYRLMYTCSAPVTAYNHVRPFGALRAAWSFLLGGGGPLGSGLFPVGGLIEATPGSPETALQVCMAPALVIRRKPGVFGVLPQRHGFTVLLNPAIPFSRGSVGLASGDPMAPPAISPNYFSDPRDLDIMATGAQRVRAMMKAPALSAVIETEIQPVEAPKTIEELKDDIRATCATQYHAAGTCRMGSDSSSVVDPQLRVRGVQGLRVVDASIMPRLVRGSTFAPTVMIAEKASDMIRTGA